MPLKHQTPQQFPFDYARAEVKYGTDPDNSVAVIGPFIPLNTKDPVEPGVDPTQAAFLVMGYFPFDGALVPFQGTSTYINTACQHVAFGVFEDGRSFIVGHNSTNIYANTLDVSATSSYSSFDGVAYTTMGIGSSVSTSMKMYTARLNAEVIWWNGNTSSTFTSLASISTFSAGLSTLIARNITSFAGRIVLGYMTESSVEYGRRVRWSADSDAADWRDAETTGAGAVDLLESSGNITGLETMDNNLIVLKEDGLLLGNETGDILAPFEFKTRIPIGCLSGKSVQYPNTGTMFFLSQDGVYALAGGSAEKVSGTFDRILLRRGRYAYEHYPRFLNSTRQMCSWIDGLHGHYCVLIPGYYGGYHAAYSSDAVGARFVACLEYNTGRWFCRELTNDDVYDAANVRYYTSAGSGGNPGPSLPHFAVNSTGYGISAQTAADWGTFCGLHGNVSLITNDFRLNPGGSATLKHVVVIYDSNNASTQHLDISTDLGRNWTWPYQTSLPNAQHAARWVTAVNKHAAQFRLKIYNHAGSSPIKIRGIELHYRNNSRSLT